MALRKFSGDPHTKMRLNPRFSLRPDTLREVAPDCCRTLLFTLLLSQHLIFEVSIGCILYSVFHDVTVQVLWRGGSQNRGRNLRARD